MPLPLTNRVIGMNAAGRIRAAAATTLGLVLVAGLSRAQPLPLADTPSNATRHPPSLPEFRSPAQGGTWPGRQHDSASRPAPPDGGDRKRLSSGRGFLLQDVEFEGNVSVSEEVLSAVAAEFIGRTVQTEDLERLRRRLTEHYVALGYVNSGATLPDQVVENGTVRFVVVEGVLPADAISVTGATRLPSGFVEQRLAQDTGPPLNVNRLGNRLELLLADPNIERVDARLLPGTSPGSSRLNVEVTQAPRSTVDFRVANDRPPSVGSLSFESELTLRSLLGAGETLTFRTEHTKGLGEYAVSASVPVNYLDTRASASYRYSESRVVEPPFDRIGIANESSDFQLGVSHPVVATPAKRLDLGLSMAFRRSFTTVDGQGRSFSPGSRDGKTALTVALIDTDWINREPDRVLALRSQFRIGLDAFGAVSGPTPTLPDTPAVDNEFLSWIAQAQFAQRLGSHGTQLVLRADLQLADEPLPAIEKFGAGGLHSVRGYRENALTGDSGINVSAEFRHPLVAVPVPAADIKVLRLELIPFVDYGYVWDDGRSGDDLLSAGLGLKLSADELLSASLFFASPEDSDTTRFDGDLQDEGVHFELQLSLDW